YELVLLCKGDGFVKINDLQRGVCGRLDVEAFAFWSNQGLDAFQGSFRATHGNAHAGKDVAHQPVRAAIELCRGNKFIPILQHTEERVRDRGHAGGGDDGGFGAFESGDLAFRDSQRGIGVTRVDIGFALAFRPAFHLFAGGKREGRGAHDFGTDRSVHAVAQRFTRMNGAGRGLEGGRLVFLHDADYWPAWCNTATTKLAQNSCFVVRREPICENVERG